MKNTNYNYKEKSYDGIKLYSQATFFEVKIQKDHKGEDYKMYQPVITYILMVWYNESM